MIRGSLKDRKPKKERFGCCDAWMLSEPTGRKVVEAVSLCFSLFLSWFVSLQLSFSNLKVWCSKMRPLWGNQRPDLLTCVMEVSLVLPCHAKCMSTDPLQTSHACHRFWNCYKTHTFGSILQRCRIHQNPLPAPPKCRFNVQKCSIIFTFANRWQRLHMVWSFLMLNPLWIPTNYIILYKDVALTHDLYIRYTVYLFPWISPRVSLVEGRIPSRLEKASILAATAALTVGASTKTSPRGVGSTRSSSAVAMGGIFGQAGAGLATSHCHGAILICLVEIWLKLRFLGSDVDLLDHYSIQKWWHTDFKRANHVQANFRR